MDAAKPSALTWATAGSGEPALPGARRDIIVIGAAMGGLSAVSKLLSGLPPAFDAAILVALDIGSQPASIVLQILRTYSRLQVSYASDGELVRRGRVLVAPPRHDMRIEQAGIVGLKQGSAYADGGPSVNALFKTAAAAYGHRVIGLVLSGASNDGTAGLSVIEAAGGVGVVQDPEAVDAAMPSSAISGDDPDYCVRLDDMAPLLVALAAGAKPSKGLLSASHL
jgi:two-component system chemotaxis response regulator CheB